MKTLMLTFALVSLAASGCSKDGAPACDKLAEALCQGKDEGACQRIKGGWLSTRMGVDSMTSTAANERCDAVVKDPTALSAYQEAAKDEFGPKKATASKSDSKSNKIDTPKEAIKEAGETAEALGDALGKMGKAKKEAEKLGK